MQATVPGCLTHKHYQVDKSGQIGERGKISQQSWMGKWGSPVLSIRNRPYARSDNLNSVF